ncbi:tetraacyldisaccharide 4'-kinase [Sulfurovum sp.]|uniref:tetraacyldisaccharide 4'-kinase n=3 Tax=Sulfurovum sp. TaxID=1969726 RepID=UPI0025D782E6|nr:tetraacyldisaccharide 4'-kinase [Sulfurovum sp.]
MSIAAAYEQMLFQPKWYHYPLIFLLLPLSFLYGTYMSVRRIITAKKTFGLPIVSVGNLIVGGSGKTPFTIALASRYSHVTVISRGYGRKSSGLLEVSRKGKILISVEESGDEAMLMALSLPEASVIVCEDRHKAIVLAREQGAGLILLDDGFNRVEIEKFEIILEPETIHNPFPFPSGPFREFGWNKRYADCVLKEGRDFERIVSYEDLHTRMLLVTAISNPERLDRYLPEGVVKKIWLKDHAYFDEKMLKDLLKEYDAQSILVTQKDLVKMRGFKLPISQIKLKLNIKEAVFRQVDGYIQTFKKA